MSFINVCSIRVCLKLYPPSHFFRVLKKLITFITVLDASGTFQSGYIIMSNAFALGRFLPCLDIKAEEPYLQSEDKILEPFQWVQQTTKITWFIRCISGVDTSHCMFMTIRAKTLIPQRNYLINLQGEELLCQWSHQKEGTLEWEMLQWSVQYVFYGKQTLVQSVPGTRCTGAKRLDICSKFKINSVPVSVALVSNGSLCPQFLQQGWVDDCPQHEAQGARQVWSGLRLNLKSGQVGVWSSGWVICVSICLMIHCFLILKNLIYFRSISIIFVILVLTGTAKELLNKRRRDEIGQRGTLLGSWSYEYWFVIITV